MPRALWWSDLAEDAELLGADGVLDQRQEVECQQRDRVLLQRFQCHLISCVLFSVY